MMYNDVDNDLTPFSDTIDGEEIFLFSNPKTSSTGGVSFLHEDDDEHLRHQHNVVAGTSSHHMPVDVDELLMNSNFLEQPNCDQTADPLFWNCKDISDDQLNEFLPQSQLNLNGNISNGNGSSGLIFGQQHNLGTVNQSATTTSSSTSLDQHLQQANQLQHQHHHQHQHQHQHQHHHQQHVTSHQHHHQQHHHQTVVIPQQQPSQVIQHTQRHVNAQHTQHEPYQITIISGTGGTHQQHLIAGGPLLNGADGVITQAPTQFCQPIVVTSANGQQHLIGTTLDQNSILVTGNASDGIAGIPHTVTTTVGNLIIDQYGNQHTVQHASIPTMAGGTSSNNINSQQQQSQLIPQLTSQQQGQIASHLQNIVTQTSQNVTAAQSAQETRPNITAVKEKLDPVKIERSKPSQQAQDEDGSKKEVAAKQSKPKEKQTRLDCPYCKRSFSKNFDLQQHMRCHTGEKPFQCIVCGRGFAQKSNVKKHMQAHKVWPEGPNHSPMPSNTASARSRNNSASSSVGTPRDDECMQENESLQINDNNNNTKNNGTTLGLSNDRKNDGNDIFAENRYSCSYCTFNGRTYFELKSHLTIHKREKVFKCIVSSCGKTFSGSDLQGFLDHVTGHKDLIYHCHLCSGQFYSLDEFGEHQKHHSNAQLKRTSQSQSLPSSQQQTQLSALNRPSNTSLRQQNQQVVPTQLQQQQNQRQYNQQQPAPTNQQQLSNQKNSRLFNNARPRNNQKFFRCSKCMNRYTTQTALDHHLSISTHNFPCTECNKVFMCERYLRRHLNTHTAVQHVCTFCDKHFKTAAYLKMHSVVHTGEKPFRCNQCEAAFNRRDKLNRHKLTHETVKKFKCPFRPHIGCTKEFNRPDKLKAHVLTHSGIRPHPCDECSRTFSRLSRLREHKKLHHDNNNNVNLSSNESTPTSIDAAADGCLKHDDDDISPMDSPMTPIDVLAQVETSVTLSNVASTATTNAGTSTNANIIVEDLKPTVSQLCL